MTIKHNDYGFSWCDSVIMQNNKDNLEKIDFIRYARTKLIKKKKPTLYETASLPVKNDKEENNERKISTNNESFHKIDETASEEKETSFSLQNLMSSEEISKIEHSKHVNSMISENLSLPVSTSSTHANVNINNSIQTCSYFNLLPISPSMCHSYTTSSFFSSNEINVSNMLVSNVEASVEECFCDDLMHDNDMNI